MPGITPSLCDEPILLPNLRANGDVTRADRMRLLTTATFRRPGRQEVGAGEKTNPSTLARRSVQ